MRQVARMRRYEWASTVLTSNRPVEDWRKLLGDTAAVTVLLDRLLNHAHVLKMRAAELAHQGPDDSLRLYTNLVGISLGRNGRVKVLTRPVL